MEKARQERRWYVVIVLFILAGLVLRVPGMGTDFWLDEIWSLYIVHHQVRSVVDVFTVARVDNNHPLNTLLMYWMGDWADWWVYRIPALVAGLGSIAMAMRIGGRRSRAHAVAAGVVFAISFPMILYSTEARGYGPMIFFKLWMVDELDLYHIDFKRRRCVSFAAAVILGLLSNFAFVLGYAATFIWSVCELYWKTHWRLASRRLLAMHIVPLAFTIFYFGGFIARLQVGGSSGESPAEVAKQSLSFAVGLGNGVNGTILAAGVALVLSVAIAVVIGKTARRLLALLIPGIWVIPVLILVAGALHGDRWLSPRHFLMPMTLLLLAGAFAFGECWNWRGTWRGIGCVLLVGIAGANLWQDVRFDQLGRGHYLEAVDFMLAQNRSDANLTLASDYPNRTQMILDFYWRYVPHDVRMEYVMPVDVARVRPEWYIGEADSSRSNSARSNVPGPQDRDVAGLRYQSVASYPCYGLSGESWTVYRRVAQ